MTARFYWFTFAIGFGLLVVGMHALLHGYEWNDSLRRFCLGVLMAFGLRADSLGQYVGYPKPSGLYRIADAVGFGAVLSLVPVVLSAEVGGVNSGFIFYYVRGDRIIANAKWFPKCRKIRMVAWV